MLWIRIWWLLRLLRWLYSLPRWCAQLVVTLALWQGASSSWKEPSVICRKKRSTWSAMILIHTMAVKQWKFKEFKKKKFPLKPPIHEVRLVHGLMMWIRNSDYIYFLSVFAFVLKFLWASAHCTLRFLLQPVGLKVWNCILRCFAALSCTCWEWIFRTRLAVLWPLITKMFPPPYGSEL